MKNLIYFFIFISFKLMGQNIDPHWIILNNLGKGSGLTINDKFEISNIYYPCLTCNTKARKNFFAIYYNGDHYNSRQYPSQEGSPGINSTTPYTFAASSSISYLYLTNIYQRDDPPSISVGPISGNTNNSFAITDPTEVLTASHDIIKNKDITLILDLNDKEYVAPLTLKMVQFRSKLTNEIVTSSVQVFDTSNVFYLASTSIFCYPQNNNISLLSNHAIRIPEEAIPGSKLIYINIKPKINLDTFFPNYPDVVKYSAIFELIDTNLTVIDTLEEALRDSHDPNYVQVLAINKKKNGDQFVKYHAQFKNTSFEPASDLSIKLTLPKGFITSSVDPVLWKVGKSERPGRILIDQQEVTFEFPPGSTVIKCKSPQDDMESIGFVEFWVKVDRSVDVESYSTSLEPINRGTRFGKTSYVIYDFFDLYKDSLQIGLSRAELLNKEQYPRKCFLIKCWWLWILLGLIIIFLYLRRKNKKPEI